MTRSAAKQELARRLGADEVVAAADGDPVAAVRALAGGFGADVVIQCVGDARVDEQAIAMGGPGGRVVLIGAALEPFSVRAAEIFWRELSVLGSRGFVPDDIRDAIDLYLDGTLDVRHLVERVRPLEEANEALADLVAAASFGACSSPDGRARRAAPRGAARGVRRGADAARGVRASMQRSPQRQSDGERLGRSLPQIPVRCPSCVAWHLGSVRSREEASVSAVAPSVRLWRRVPSGSIDRTAATRASTEQTVHPGIGRAGGAPGHRPNGAAQPSGIASSTQSSMLGIAASIVRVMTMTPSASGACVLLEATWSWTVGR